MRILVTGGAGYIGSHTALELLEAGHDVTVVDNLENGSEEALRRVERLTGRALAFHRADVRDAAALDRVLAAAEHQAVIHFAGLKAVGESVAQPLRYHDNNVRGAIVLFEALARHGVKRLVFSSSATVYGEPNAVPITEDFPVRVTNPYGRTKLFIEEILRDVCQADPSWHVALLRYFNPVGAHPSGQIGEDPRGIPNNLMPFVAQVAVGQRPELRVFGGDYPTRDGTGVRDYIHVVDLARGHLASLAALEASPGVATYNLGTGRGQTVLEVVAAFERASGRKVPYRVVARRPGDVAECYASVDKARRELGWEARRTLDDMCADVWRWQSQNPRGYGG
ncbi:MAG TPA: UDP-glucose 4-epimerase GalE [Polyangiaceae bacterium]|nr:UDP-glucose 4-epimerase GalE [Polyangiaceae bacterium]